MGWNQYNEVKDVLVCRKLPFTKGMVTESELFRTKSSGQYDISKRVAIVSYSYSVGLKDFKGKVSTEAYFFTAGVDRFAHKYPKGSQITVYYHPERPDRSLVEPGLNLSLLKMLVSLLLLFMGLLLLVGCIKLKIAQV